MEKHTPGPWRIGTAGAIVADHNEGLPMDASCREFYGGNIFICESVTGANARLIAAAPQLLEALEAIVAEADQSNGGKGARLPIVIYMKELAETAIRSAKGEL